MTPPADWLSERPRLPRREQTPLYEQALTAAAQIREDLEARESTAVLYRVEELQRVLDPVWPSVDPDTVEFRRPRRTFGRWLRDNWNVKRGLAGGASAVVFLATALGRWLA